MSDAQTNNNNLRNTVDAPDIKPDIAILTVDALRARCAELDTIVREQQDTILSLATIAASADARTNRVTAEYNALRASLEPDHPDVQRRMHMRQDSHVMLRPRRRGPRRAARSQAANCWVS